MKSSFLALLLAVLLAGHAVVALPKVQRLSYPGYYKLSPAFKALQSTVQFAATSSSSPSTAPKVTAPKDNVWASLSNDEAASVIAWLHDHSGLNLTAKANATAWDNSIDVVDLLTPNKTDVLSYLDGSGPKPSRWAVATIQHGSSSEPYIEDVAVGPLPISNETRLQNLDWLSTKGNMKMRNYGADGDEWYDWFNEVSAGIKDITKDLINGTATGAEDDDFTIFGVDPLWHEDGRIVQWLGFWGLPKGYEFDASTLLPQGLYFKADTTGRERKGWKVTGWLYNDQYFPSTEAFRAAWEAGELKRPEKINDPYAGDEPWYGTDQAGDKWDYDVQPPPVMVAPSGQRFSVDEARKYVEWQGFSFYTTFTRDTGLRIFDIKYNGQRVIYELGLQEAVAHYAGNDPVQSGTAYLDTYYGFGPYAFELVQGYDCPAYAHYMDATFHAAEESRTHRNAICLFEQDMHLPIQRHSSGSYVSVTKNVALVLRTVSTVGNYDYTFTYTFYQDGSIEIKVSASGYIQSAFYAANEDYGYRIKDGLSGSMHDHVLNFKMDVDIFGTKNSFAKHHVVPKSVDYKWGNGTARNTMQLQKTYLEKEAAINWPKNGGSMYMVVNKDETNKYGEPRGYRIMPLSGGGHFMTIQESPNLLNSDSFAKHHLYVTKQKDTEPRVAHANNNLDPANPAVRFSAFYEDEESLDQEDLVLWFNLGMTHVPHTGDLPNTVQTTAQSSLIFSPHNYLRGDPSRHSSQQVRIEYGSGDGRADKVHTFGAQSPSNASYDISRAFPDLHSYAGDEAVRKFPYSPNDPFNDTLAIV